ncbi:argonaute/piwi family protein [Aspergillus saccharolyticus JOP 1030-1]|uniref:Piwi domain-containing protein n=1 Tax=Aspergillus saccharolyticus JOP 1030-1 TaxID=1450539 RepID=A0A318ZE19_9EURO|nr:hypothetical protein BP01DRAFT_384886 [Aspergillus saccharolyticus JOP 1030-1]PYH42933.1 hypothetical protein BP01DRAFT_384886 [Aspergillus saccharolyticus JOP 1030-1]
MTSTLVETLVLAVGEVLGVESEAELFLDHGGGPREVQFWLEGAGPKTIGKIKSKGKKPANSGPDESGRYTTVENFFRERYGINVDSNVPVVNVGTRQDPSYLPVEVCVVIAGQAAGVKLRGRQTQNMIRFAVRNPAQNALSITTKGAGALGLTPQLNTTLGTARPAHYYIVWDEIFSVQKPQPPFENAADLLEDLTHSMCYLFGRATRAVSICPPAYYADLVCERVRCYLKEVFDASAESSISGSMLEGGGGTGRMIETSDVRVHQNVRNTMYYI